MTPIQRTCRCCYAAHTGRPRKGLCEPCYRRIRRTLAITRDHDTLSRLARSYELMALAIRWALKYGVHTWPVDSEERRECGSGVLTPEP